MVKHILLVFLLLFMPFVANSADLVVNSKNDLTRYILPLDMDVVKSLLPTLKIGKDLVSLEPGSDEYNVIIKAIYNGYEQGAITVPFSAKELLELCRNEFVQVVNCGDFVLNYAKAIAEKGTFVRNGSCDWQFIWNTDEERDWIFYSLEIDNPRYVFPTERDRDYYGKAYVCDPDQLDNGCQENDKITLEPGSIYRWEYPAKDKRMFVCTRSENGSGYWMPVKY